jgi:hypothetical protein
MRIAFLLASLTAALSIAGSAGATPGAQSAFVERRGLLEADARCNIFTPNIRFALEAGAVQARGALLRGGWTQARLDELERAAIGAARERACNDPRTATAAAAASASFASWARTPAMQFTGSERAWSARRFADPAGWLLKQDIPAPSAATFGVRQYQGAEQLSILVRSTGPLLASAQLVMRDPARARANLDIPGRNVRGLEAGAPSSASAQRFLASGRRIETIGGERFMAFAFPQAAFQAMLALDPREAVEVRLGADGQSGRYLIEVGDVAAARAFLAIRDAR